jgi:hypothetical protein
MRLQRASGSGKQSNNWQNCYKEIAGLSQGLLPVQKN